MQTKIIFVTGSTRGIGKAIADMYEKNGHVVIRNSRTDYSNTYEYFIQGDINVASHIEDIKTYINNKFGKLDILVNNAAYTKFIDHKNLDLMSEKEFDQIYLTNVKTPFLLIQKLYSLMNHDSNIINIASVAGTTANGSNIAYCASKAAIINMTKSLARAIGPIRVNSVSPGLTKTEFVTFPGNYVNETIDQTPLNKIGYPVDVANVVFSVTEYMTHVTGQDFIVDGGKILNS